MAALANKPGASQEQVARDLGVSLYSVSRWKKLYANGPAGQPSGVGALELECENRALRRENEELRQQRSILKNALAIVSEAPRGGMA